MIMPKPLRSSLSENLSGFNASSPTGTIIGIASITVVASIGGADRSKPDAWRLTVEWRHRVEGSRPELDQGTTINSTFLTFQHFS
jgi:hypothetical protein